jgi:hypothetical protein
VIIADAAATASADWYTTPRVTVRLRSQALICKCLNSVHATNVTSANAKTKKYQLLALIHHVQEAYLYAEVRVAREQDVAANQNFRVTSLVSVCIVYV